MAAWILPLISGVTSIVGGGIRGFFGLKESQTQLVADTIRELGSANSSAAVKEQAIAQIVAAEASSGYWLAAVWRPMVMTMFAGLIMAYFFGYTTENLAKPLPVGTALAELFDLLKIGLMGYIPARTIEKVADKFATTRNLQLLTEYFTKSK
jgi:hypothetical protein